jgi:hypothetical protein
LARRGGCVAIVAELAVALDAMRSKRAIWNDIRESAWNDRYEFTQMVALGKAIDRLIRGKLALAEPTLTTLAKIVIQRNDCSELRLTAQLEHYAKTQPVSGTLRAALRAMTKHFSWKKKLVARINWVAAPAQPSRVRAAARPPRR